MHWKKDKFWVVVGSGISEWGVQRQYALAQPFLIQPLVETVLERNF